MVVVAALPPPEDATVAWVAKAVAATLPSLDTTIGIEQQGGEGEAVVGTKNTAAEEEPRSALVVPSPEAAANGTGNVHPADTLIPSSVLSGVAPSVASAAAEGSEFQQRR